MDSRIGAGIVANADTGVQPDAFEGTLRIVGVDETAFGAFEMMRSERVGDTAKAKWVGVVERRGVKGYWKRIRPVCAQYASKEDHVMLHGRGLARLTHPIPTALNRYRSMQYHGAPRHTRSEVGVGHHQTFMTFTVPQRESVIEVGRFRKVQRTCSSIVPIVCGQQGPNVLDLGSRLSVS